jgi:dipeptidyl aminopeptidase/acylaminoacyl peptidase
MRRWLAAALAAAWLAAGPGWARPFTVDDLLHQESLGALAVDPTGRWLVLERRDRYDSARRFDYAFATSQTLGRLFKVDLRHPAEARPLLARDRARGLLIAGFSPKGERLAVYWMHGRAWTFGVVTLATGEIRLFELTPEQPGRGRVLQWLSEDELLVIARSDGLPPLEQRIGWTQAARLPPLWAAAARGEAAVTVQGSGAYADVRRRAPPNRLVRVDAATGATHVLAVGPFRDLELSPDHRRVALFEAGADIQPRPDGPVRGPAGSETERTQLSILDLASGRRRAIDAGGDLLPNLLAWSPDSTALLVYRRGDDGLWTSGSLARVAAKTGAVAPVGAGLELQARLNPVSVRAGWMGDTPVAYARPAGQPGAGFDWWRLDAGGATNLTRTLPPGDRTVLAVDRYGLTVLAGDRPWRVNDTGAVRALAEAPAAPALRAFPGTLGSRLIQALPAGTWVTIGAGRPRTLAWIDGGGVHPALTLPAGLDELGAASLEAQAAIARGIDAHGVERVTVARAGTTPVTVTTINADLADTDPLVALPVHHAGEHGEAVTSWLFPAAPGSAPAPLLVRPYLGANATTAPRDAPMEGGFLQNLRVLTSHGYAVLVPSLPNPPSGMTDPAAHVADRIEAVIAAAQADPRLAGLFDTRRAGLIGWSFGGYTTLATLTQTDRFRAAVAMDGISDLTAYWASLPAARLVSPQDGYVSNWHTGAVEQTQPELHAPPWVDPDRYHRNSPLLAADRIRTPLLLIHGAQDAVPSAGSEAIYSALFRQDKDALLVTYWGELHSPTSPGDVRDVYARTFEFLDRYLTPCPAQARAAVGESGVRVCQ